MISNNTYVILVPSLFVTQAVPAEFQRMQRYKDLLLDNTEKILLSVHPVRKIQSLRFEETSWALLPDVPNQCSWCNSIISIGAICCPSAIAFIHYILF